MASIIRRALVYWTLAQVVLFCAALGKPVHILLNLDGKNITDGKLAKLPGLVKIRYNAQDATKPKYSDAGQKNLVESPGLKKLYIRGTFEIEKKNGDNAHFVWDNQKKDAKQLAELILNIFKSDAVVIVVFPEDLQTYVGYEFQKEFEEVVREKKRKITVGRGVINVYLGLGDQNQESQVQKLLNEEIDRQKNEKEWDFVKKEKYYSIFATYSSNAFSFETVFSHGSPEPEDLFRVQIQEADSVSVKLMAVCTDKNELKVGSQDVKGLADILLKLLRDPGVETHPKQRVRVELPKSCGAENKRKDFTNSLVDHLLTKDLNAFGKEPMVHMHVYDGGDKDNNFLDDIGHIREAHSQDIFVEIKNRVIQTQVDNDDRVKASSAKELFIHIHCHGKFISAEFTVCRVGSLPLAKILSELVKKLLDQNVERVEIVKFHVCNAGRPVWQEYIIDFLTKFDALLGKYKINIKESLSYKSATSQVREHNQVMVPCETSDSGIYNVNEKQVYIRFTVRTTKTAHGYKAFTVLPFTEYNILYSE